MRPHAIVGVAVLATVALAFAVPSVAASALQTAAERPAGAFTDVEILFGEGGEHGRAYVDWVTAYPARSATEAARAENDTLSVDWFRGPEHVRAAVASHSGSRVTEGNIAVDYLPPESDEESDLGRIHVHYSATWEGVFAGDRSQVVVGPRFAAGLSEGDTFGVVVPKSWDAVSANADRSSGGSEVLDSYRWTIGDDPTPRVVFDERVLGPDLPWSDGVPGPGPALALLAVLMAAGVRWLHADV